MRPPAHPARAAAGLALALAAAGCGDLAYQVPVERERDAALRFPFGEVAGDCDGEHEGVVYERREEAGVTYCRISASWSGVLFSMVEVRDGIQEEIDELELPVDVDDITVTFTDLRVEGLSVVLQRDDEPVEMPTFTGYAASGEVEGVAGILSVTWSDESEKGPEHPDVQVLDETGTGGRNALLARLNEAYDNQEEVSGSGAAEVELVFDLEELARLSGAELGIDFTLITEGAGSLPVNQVFSTLGE